MPNISRMAKKKSAPIKTIDEEEVQDDSDIESDLESSSDESEVEINGVNNQNEISDSDTEEFAPEMLSDSDIDVKDIKKIIKKKVYSSDSDDESTGSLATDDDECIYEYIEDEEVKPISLIVPNEERITRPIMSKYEMIRILATRTAQLVKGAPISVKLDQSISDTYLDKPIQIAKLELKYKTIPFKIRRPLPNGKFEEWRCSELEIPNIDFPI